MPPTEPIEAPPPLVADAAAADAFASPPAESPAPAPAPVEVDEDTTHERVYVILESRDGGTTWAVLGEQSATSRTAALALHFGKDVPQADDGQPPIQWNLVTPRQWKPLVAEVPPPEPPPVAFVEA